MKLRRRLLQILAPQRLTWEEAFRPSWVVRGAGRFSAGQRTYWFGDSVFQAWKRQDSIELGAYCSIAQGVTIVAGGNHLVDALSTYPFTMIDRWREGIDEPQPAQRIEIGNDVWIGTNATIVGDLTIGDGAVIGAGAVVVGDIPAYAVAAGVPARVLRYRFSAEDIRRLQAIRWWEWPEPVVLEAEPILRSGDVGALAEFADRHLPAREAAPSEHLSAEPGTVSSAT